MKHKPAAGQRNQCNSQFLAATAFELKQTERGTVTALEPKRALGYAGAGFAATIAGPREHPLLGRKSSMLGHNPAKKRVWGKLAFWAFGLGLCLTWLRVASAQTGDGATASAVAELSPNKLAPPSALPISEAEAARDSTIVGIDVAGNRRVTTQDILTYLHERVNDAFVPERLSQDVRELWNSGFFDDIEVNLQRSDAGVRLRFTVRERANVTLVEIEGNDEIDDDDIQEAIELKANTILSYPAINRSVQKIRDMYAEKGYFLAEVDSEVVPLKNNEVRVRFNVRENSQVSVRRVNFLGNEHISDEELRDAMITGNGGLFALGSGEYFAKMHSNAT